MKKTMKVLAEKCFKVQFLFLMLLMAGVFQACSDDDDVTLNTSADELTFMSTGGTQELGVECSGTWIYTVANGCTWCKGAMDSENSQIIVTVDANTTDEARDTYIVVAGPEVCKRVNIHQNAVGEDEPETPEE